MDGSCGTMNVYFILFLGFFAFIEVNSKRSKGLGSCPSFNIATPCVLDYKFHCFVQKQCPSGYRCCSYGCNRRCVAVRVNGKHLGSCRKSSGRKGKKCKKDSSCKRHEKCCKKRCRRVRKKIVPVRRPFKK
ncbi:perlwapin-like protein [Mytilus californianus]|uniref:perlwapin-like protein n=1 Tax=Mytilus californianus TaxID=6549 RepID=UPI00224830F5|nr:perlwapin-like protein [Mytilus californianus]